MKKIIALTSMVGIFLASQALASGYRIPEQSMTSVALSGAYIANALGADASYHNPANMGWTGEGWQTDANFTYINLASTKYTDTRTSAAFNFDGKAEDENFLLPQLHLVSPDLNNFRVGVSVVIPAGLSKRWKNQYATLFAENFSLQVTEISPSVSYTLADKYAVAGGIRIIRAEAKAVSNGTISFQSGDLTDQLPDETVYTNISRSMEGDTVEYGYNLAISAKATDALTFSTTYRSRVDLDLDGDATLNNTALTHSLGINLVEAGSYQGSGKVSLPIPAVLTLAAAYTFGPTTVELVWDRTFWSKYENLDFNYPSQLENNILIGAFDAPISKNWHDTDAVRLGITHILNKTVTLMAAIAIDENPIPEETLNFEVPDSDARLFSCGARYVVNKQLTMGASYLYDYKVSRTVTNDKISGKFTDAAAHMLSVGAQYIF